MIYQSAKERQLTSPLDQQPDSMSLEDLNKSKPMKRHWGVLPIVM